MERFGYEVVVLYLVVAVECAGIEILHFAQDIVNINSLLWHNIEQDAYETYRRFNDLCTQGMYRVMV